MVRGRGSDSQDTNDSLLVWSHDEWDERLEYIVSSSISEVGPTNFKGESLGGKKETR
jgi:hypothetical protein